MQYRILNRSIGIITLTVLIDFLNCSVRSQTLPPNLPTVAGAGTNATVTVDLNSGIFTYTYMVTDSSVSKGNLDRFLIDITTTAGGVILGSQGLSNTAPGFSTAVNLNTEKIIPVGVISAPPRWKSGIDFHGEVDWFSLGLDTGIVIAPSDSKSGFAFTSHGPPGIRKFKVRAFFDIDDPRFFPLGIDQVATDAEATQISKNVSAAMAATSFSGFTVGPISPPSLTDPALLLDFLVSLKHQSISVDWISGPGSDGIVNSLDVKLNAAKDSIASGDNKTAANQLNAFINELDAQHGKSINDNAYFLLKANAQFILSKLGP